MALNNSSFFFLFSDGKNRKLYRQKNPFFFKGKSKFFKKKRLFMRRPWWWTIFHKRENKEEKWLMIYSCRSVATSTYNHFSYFLLTRREKRPVQERETHTSQFHIEKEKKKEFIFLLIFFNHIVQWRVYPSFFLAFSRRVELMDDIVCVGGIQKDRFIFPDGGK